MRLMLAKLGITLASDKRFWTAVGTVITAFLMPFILIIVILCSILSGTANHNNAAVELTFYGGNLPLTMPMEYKNYITEMRSCFDALDSAISNADSLMEDGDSLDSNRVKAVFYALNFGTDDLELRKTHARNFVHCFIKMRPCTHHWVDSEGKSHSRTHMRAYPINDLETIYENVSHLMRRDITQDDKANITEIYLRVVYRNFDVGGDMSLNKGNATHDLIKEMQKNSAVSPSASPLASPIDQPWRSIVTSEFGFRRNPTGSGGEGHTGIDLGISEGTKVKAAKEGKVLFVRQKLTGYGYHIVIDHGNGQATLYAHCSEILVAEGEEVSQGQLIAKSGNTGRSTGPHLHFEVIENGVPQNPRKYLP